MKMKIRKYFYISCLQTQRKPSRWPQMLAALSYAEKLVECYDFETGDWVVMTEKPGHSFGSAMVALQVSIEKQLTVLLGCYIRCRASCTR